MTLDESFHPTVLVLGGLGAQDGARHLITYLLSPSCNPSPRFCRVVDKALVIPAAGVATTYIDDSCKQAFKSEAHSGKLEYLQGNLLVEATRKKAFTLPEAHGGPAKAFDWVFDFTGESEFDLPEAVYIERTLALALGLGKSAADAKVAVYLRMLSTQYKTSNDGPVGAVDTKAAEPWGTRASWHHEAARGLSKIEGLNLVLLRPAFFYGPYTLTGITPRVLIGEVYRYLGEKLEFLWKESLAVNTIHSQDFCSAAVAVANWAHGKSRSELSSTSALEDLPSTLKSDQTVSAIPLAARKTESCAAPVFTLVDDGDVTQSKIASVIESVVGVPTSFVGTLVSQFAKMNMSDVLEDVNDKHAQGWSDLLTASDPPISTTVPISATTPVDLLQPYPLLFSNSKLKELTGWTPLHALNEAVVRDTIDKFKAEGNWPQAKAKASK